MVLASLFLPPRCAACGVVGPSPCGSCIAALTPLGEIDLGSGISRCLVVMDYDGLACELIAALKYRGRRTSAAWFVDAMAGRVREAGLRPDAITWAPAAPHHVRRRGYDQGAVLGRGLARRLRLPSVDAFVRTGRQSQTGRGRAERLRGPDLALRAGAAALIGPTVLVVDDVITTGATMVQAAQVLLSAGVRRVDAMALAHRR